MKKKLKFKLDPLHSIPHMFDRAPTEEYLQEWTDTLRKPRGGQESKKNLSVVIFRLGEEWFALPTIYFKEITHHRPVHTLPHFNRGILLGTVNLNGELQLYVNLHQLLDIPSSFSTEKKIYPRIMAIIKEGELWVFPVDEVEGIFAWDLAELENVPVNITKSSINYLKAIFNKNDQKVGLFDEELLFSSLKRSIQ